MSYSSSRSLLEHQDPDRSVNADPTTCRAFAAITNQVFPLNITITRRPEREIRSALTPAGKATGRFARQTSWRVWGLALLAAIVFLGIVLSPARAAVQQSVSISRVEVSGNTTIPAQAILQHVRSHPDRPVNPQQIREDKRALYRTRWFSRVEHEIRSEQAGNVLVFIVTEQPIVRAVRYDGARAIKPKKLALWTGLQVGSPMDPGSNREAARQIKRRYEEAGFRFATVELVKGGSPTDREVVFKINEGPKVRVFRRRILGANFIGAARLKTKLATKAAILGLPVGGLYNPETITSDVDIVKQYYHSLGFFDVDVDAAPQFSKDKAWVTVDYRVKEGKRYKVRNIELQGNAVLSNKKLTRDRRLNPGDFFNALHLQRDVQKMTDQYDARGHYFAQVQPTPRFSENAGVVDLVYQIDEDRVRLLREMKVHFTNERSNTKETVIRDRSPFSPGDPISKKDLRRMAARLRNSGIFEQSQDGVDIRVTRVDGPAFLAASPGVTRGQTPAPQPKIGTQTGPRKDRLIGFGHSVGYGSTQPMSRGERQQEQARNPKSRPSTKRPQMSDPSTMFRGQSPAPFAPIVRGQNFDGANPMYDNNPQGNPYGRALTTPPPGFVDVDVFARNGRTGRLMFGGGVNSDAGIVGQFVYDEADFDLFRPPRSWIDIVDGRAWRGGGQRFRIEAIPGDTVSRYSVSWTDPYFMYSDYSLSVSGSYFNRFYPDWDERRGGGKVSIGKQFTPQFSMTGTIRLEEVKISGARGFPGPPPSLASAIGSSFLSTFRLTATHDTRDSSILPSEGHYTQLAYEQAFGEFDYPRLEAEYRQFWTLFSRPDESGRHVFSLTGNVGWTGGDTPIFENFYAGGFQSFRGFAFRGVSPTQNGVAVGGQWMALGSAEYRFPITAGDAIQGVFFTDFGTIEPDVSFDAFRLTVGAGLRVTVPQMGPVPLAFDFGFPILSEAGDDERIFTFYVSMNR